MILNHGVRGSIATYNVDNYFYVSSVHCVEIITMAITNCVEDCKIISIPKKKFDEKFNVSEVFVNRYLNTISYRLRKFKKMIHN